MAAASLLRLVVSTVASYATTELLLRQAQARPQLRRLLVSVLLFFIAAMMVGTGLVLLIVSLFFKLAEIEPLVMPALIAGGISVLIALLLANEGRRRLKVRTVPS